MEATCYFGRFHSSENSRLMTGAYFCNVKKVSGASQEKEILSFSGVHEEGKTNKDVIWLEIGKQPLGFVPKNLPKMFPNMRYLTLRDCGIEEISREDFEGLEALEYVDLTENKLISLPDDLFLDMKKLRLIFFNDNKIERMSSKLLQPIRGNLEMAYFSSNARINECFDKISSSHVTANYVAPTGAFSRLVPGPSTFNNNLDMFMKLIDSTCWPPDQRSQIDELIGEFANFRLSGKFTDFAFKFRGKEFKLHKMVFAAQSSVFDRIFTENGEEMTESFRKMEKISEATLESFLDYFYTRKVDKAVNLVEMFELATIFDVSALKAICRSKISNKLPQKAPQDASTALQAVSTGKQLGPNVCQEGLPTTVVQQPQQQQQQQQNSADSSKLAIEALKEEKARLKLMLAAHECMQNKFSTCSLRHCRTLMDFVKHLPACDLDENCWQTHCALSTELLEELV